MLKVELVEPKGTVEEVVDADLKTFDAWFGSLGNDPMTGPEKAIIKTYLAWKLGLAKVGG